MSTFGLLVTTIGTGALSSVAANYAREKNWSKTKLYSAISASIAGLAVLVALFITIKGASTPGAMMGEIAIGVNIAYVMLMITMLGAIALDIMAAVESDKQNEKDAMAFSVSAAILCFLMFILSIVVIGFLL